MAAKPLDFPQVAESLQQHMEVRHFSKTFFCHNSCLTNSFWQHFVFMRLDKAFNSAVGSMKQNLSNCIVLEDLDGFLPMKIHG